MNSPLTDLYALYGAITRQQAIEELVLKAAGEQALAALAQGNPAAQAALPPAVASESLATSARSSFDRACLAVAQADELPDVPESVEALVAELRRVYGS